MSNAAAAKKDYPNVERCGGLSKTTVPKVREMGPSTLKESSTAGNTNITLKTKPKQKVQAPRSAKSSRETSPTRFAASPAGTKTPHYPTAASAPQPDLEQPRPQRPLSNAPHWPNSTRLSLSRTPPQDSRSAAPPPRKKSETSTNQALAPTITLLREGNDYPENPEETNLPTGMRTPRSNSSTALETVVESSLPSTPAIGTSKILVEQMAALVARQPNKILEEEERDTLPANKNTRKARAGSVTSSIAPKSEAASESESGYKSEDRSLASSGTKVPPKGFTRRPTVLGKDMTSRGMTVETETVSSVPQVVLGAVGPPGGTSIRSKKSTDTIRAPKKDKRRNPRRAVVSASSKADIFAAKIAEAVDEANSSDSEETFVYESNPPESVQRPSSRFHSRTPSATSIGPDPRGQRLAPLSTIDGTQSTGRKGMKFVNNSLNKDSSSMCGDGVSGDSSVVDRNAGSSRDLLPHRERHGGRNHNAHRSILTEDNPFHRPTGQNSLVSSRHSSRPPSPKLVPYRNGINGAGSKKPGRIWASYEADVEGADDDENAPLIRTRVHRNRRPGSGSLRQLEHSQFRRRGWVRMYAGCIVAVVTIVMILTGIGGFLVATTNALVGVKILNVTDVLVSKQEIMLDLVVEAINPNAIAVTIGSMDVNLFAKSAHVREGGDDRDLDEEGESWKLSTVANTKEIINSYAQKIPTRDQQSPIKEHTGPMYRKAQSRHFQITGNVDEGTDPPDDLPPENDKETMLLGRIFSFDSVLNFDGTPFRRLPGQSIGELRLAKPGNKTEEGGTERWERVLLHPFELIVRGVLKYQLPLSGKTRTAPISGSVMIHPDTTIS
ncbi:vacuolar segregation subunit 7-domain-containing protein [Geopyxis carbonaria]|nr:vacuolar segregation subunit 7-domain-containing protein [Geopyxis carbonaria]